MPLKQLLLATAFISIFACAQAQDSTRQEQVKVNGTELFVKITGQGDTILVIHGGPGLNMEYLFPHLQGLAKSHTLIFYDQRSSGMSQLSVKANMNFNMFAEDIEGLRKYFHIQKLNILAHSWGCLVAATYLINYPEQVKSLVFSNPVPFSKVYAETSNKEAAARTTTADSLKRIEIFNSDPFKKGDVQPVEDLMMLSFKVLFCDTAKMAGLDPSLPSTYLVASLSMYGFAQDMANYDFYPKIKDNTTPCLIIHGDCDISPLEADTRLQGRFTDAKLVEFKHSGHFPFIEENKKWTETVNKFYKQM